MEKERINYTISEGYHVAHFVNFPIVIQGDSYEDMVMRCKIIFEAYVKQLNNLLTSEEPFEFVQQESFSK